MKVILKECIFLRILLWITNTCKTAIKCRSSAYPGYSGLAMFASNPVTYDANVLSGSINYFIAIYLKFILHVFTWNKPISHRKECLLI